MPVETVLTCPDGVVLTEYLVPGTWYQVPGLYYAYIVQQ